MYACIPNVYLVPPEAKEKFDSLDMELQMVVSCLVGALNCLPISLAPYLIF